MRKIVALLTTIAGTVTFYGAGHATLINGGFDAADYYMQDLSGWNIDRGSVQQGNVEVKELHITDQGTYYTPRNGKNLAVLTAGDLVVGHTGAPTGLRPTLLWQTLQATAGQQIAGAAAFDSFDMWTFGDYGFVRMFAGNAIGSILPDWAGDTGSAWQLFYDVAGEPFTDGPWKRWQWTAPTTGTYTLAFGVANGGDDPQYGGYNPSELVVDAVDAVPEPATMILFGLGLPALAFLRRRTRDS